MNHNEKKKFTYILRCAIQPGHFEKERLDSLIEFCQKAKIDDVMFFIDCEELNQGHITREEAGLWMEMISRFKNILEPMGITTSINPWITLLHGDRGRNLKAGQSFDRMVDPYGNMANAVACPECIEWRSYIVEMYKYYASIKPNMLWVEDDFRFHNHDPLVWGGCFCDTHMRKFSQLAGKELTREEFVQGILQPGEPHPYRKIWLDTCRQSMNELAQIIGAAVHEVSPYTKVGLMSSVPQVHCAEGRDWHGIFKGLSGGTPMVSRPHLPAYSEGTPQSYLWHFSHVSRQSKAVVPENTEIYPEIENFPHTRFSKSNAFTRFQIESSAILDAHGITLNIYDMMGNGILAGENYENTLAQVKDFTERVRGLGLKNKMQEGIKVLFSPGSSYTLKTREGKSMTELYPEEGFWAPLLSSFGIANTYSTSKVHKNSIIAVSGQYFRNLHGDEITELFDSNFVIMEGEAAYTLYDMGYGHLAGIEAAIWHPQDDGVHSYEQVCDGSVYSGISEARMSSQCLSGDFLEIRYSKKPLLKTVVKSPYNMDVGPGIAVIDDRVMLLPYGRFNGRVQSHLNPIKQGIMQDVLKEVRTASSPAMICNTPYAAVYEYEMGNKTAFIIVNCSGDDMEDILLYTPKEYNKDFVEINRDTPQPEKRETEQLNGGISIKSFIKSKELKVFIAEKG